MVTVAAVVRYLHSSNGSDGSQSEAAARVGEPARGVEWRDRLEREISVHVVNSSSTSYSLESQRLFEKMDREIALAPSWGQLEARRLIEYVDAVPFEASLVPQAGEASEPELTSKRDVARRAITVIGQRFSIGAPIEREAQDQIIHMLIRYTHHPESNTRFLAMNALMQSTAILERPDVLARVRKMRRNDPEHRIVRAIRQREHRLQVDHGWEGSL